MPATNKLKLFGENITAAKIRTDSDWDASMNRKTGFTNGDAADALDVNTAIKTNSLVAIALAGVVADYLPSGEIGLTTALADMQTFIKNAFNSAITFTKTADTTNGDAIKIQVFNNAVKQLNVTNAAHAKDADKLSTARTIGGVSFDGSANINLPGVNTAGNQDTSGNAATATKLKTARTINVSDNDASHTGTAASFDGSGNVTIKLPATIKAAIEGNAATATKLQTARTIGGVSFDGTADINLPGVNTAGNQNTSGKAAKADTIVQNIYRHNLDTGYLTQNYITFYGFDPTFDDGDIVCIWIECTVSSTTKYSINLGTVRIDALYSTSGYRDYYTTRGVCRGYNGIYGWSIEYRPGMGSWFWSLHFVSSTGASVTVQDVLGTGITAYKFCYTILSKAN